MTKCNSFLIMICSYHHNIFVPEWIVKGSSMALQVQVMQCYLSQGEYNVIHCVLHPPWPIQDLYTFKCDEEMLRSLGINRIWNQGRSSFSLGQHRIQLTTLTVVSSWTLTTLETVYIMDHCLYLILLFFLWTFSLSQ